MWRKCDLWADWKRLHSGYFYFFLSALLSTWKRSGIVTMLLTKFLLGVSRFPPSSFDAAPQWCWALVIHVLLPFSLPFLCCGDDWWRDQEHKPCFPLSFQFQGMTRDKPGRASRWVPGSEPGVTRRTSGGLYMGWFTNTRPAGESWGERFFAQELAGLIARVLNLKG